MPSLNDDSRARESCENPIPLEEAPPSRGGTGGKFAQEHAAALFDALKELLVARWVESVEPTGQYGDRGPGLGNRGCSMG
jgi:hypothetical protein